MKTFHQQIIKHMRLFHVLRIIIACIIAFSIDIIFKLPYGTWAPITIIVVMSAKYSGEVSDKASQRILGTTIGAILGLSLYFFPVDNVYWHYGSLIVMLCVSLYFTLGEYSYSAILTSVTLVLVAGSGPGDLHIALWRTTNVLWGGLVAIIASQYLFPAKATDHFKLVCGDFLRVFHQNYSEHNALVNSDDAYREIPLSQLRQTLNKITSLESSIGHETPAMKQPVKKAIACQVRMFNLLENIIQTQWRHQYSKEKVQEIRALSQAKEQLSLMCKQCGEDLLSPQNPLMVINKSQLEILALYPKLAPSADSRTDISYYGYLWLNRELARQVAELSEWLCQFETIKNDAQ